MLKPQSSKFLDSKCSEGARFLFTSLLNKFKNTKVKDPTLAKNARMGHPPHFCGF